MEGAAEGMDGDALMNATVTLHRVRAAAACWAAAEVVVSLAVLIAYFWMILPAASGTCQPTQEAQHG